MKSKLLKGNNIELLKTLEPNSIDSVLTDAPYGLSFMNKKWDYDVPSVEFWKEVYRVLKPGGHILCFGGTRTYHRMVVNIEDAGFEIRDCIQWIYGSGFPKSLNIGKGIDKLEGNEREEIDKIFPDGSKPRETQQLKIYNENEKYIGNPKYTKCTSEWEGWGSALKPANEPIVLVRKPLDKKTIVENVKEWGTGGININGCRIGSDIITTTGYGYNPTQHEGRFPSNVILDEEAAQVMDEQSNGTSRFFYVAKVGKKERNLGLDDFEEKNHFFLYETNTTKNWSDGSINFQKVQPRKNYHPTVKPINLLTYLVRMITPPDGVVLDAYMGSGSTGIAALLEGFNFVGMEMDEDYFNIAEARINNYEQYRKILK